MAFGLKATLRTFAAAAIFCCPANANAQDAESIAREIINDDFASCLQTNRTEGAEPTLAIYSELDAFSPLTTLLREVEQEIGGQGFVIESLRARAEISAVLREIQNAEVSIENDLKLQQDIDDLGLRVDFVLFAVPSTEASGITRTILTLQFMRDGREQNGKATCAVQVPIGFRSSQGRYVLGEELNSPCARTRSCLSIEPIDHAFSNNEPTALAFELSCNQDVCQRTGAAVFCGLHVQSDEKGGQFIPLFPHALDFEFLTPDSPDYWALSSTGSTVALNDSLTYPSKAVGWKGAFETDPRTSSMECWLVDSTDDRNLSEYWLAMNDLAGAIGAQTLGDPTAVRKGMIIPTGRNFSVDETTAGKLIGAQNAKWRDRVIGYLKIDNLRLFMPNLQ